MNRIHIAAVSILALATVLLPTARAAGQGTAQDDDLDAFMEKVLDRRITNWEDLYRYTVRDREEILVTGPGGEKIESQVGEYTWYVRDGYMVRSPDRMNGARVGDDERERAEQKFLARARERDAEREQAAEADAEGSDPGAAEGVPAESGGEREYFLGFPFEKGNYYLVGFEQFEGQDVARIEYYPEMLFEDDGDTEDDAEMLRNFQKTSRVTLWVLVEEHQIVKAAWDSVSFDFLPMRWLAQVDDVQAELVMHKPFPNDDVWLPRELSVSGRVSVATGSYSMRYSLEYFDYKETDVGARVRFRIPGVER